MFTSSSGYALVKQEIGQFLVQNSFHPYKSATYYRTTPGGILQFFLFQKGTQSLKDQLTINVVIQGLYSPACSFTVLQPGGRFGKFIPPGKDIWWHCNDEESTSHCISELRHRLSTILLPDLQQRMSSADQLITTFNAPQYSFLWRGQNTFIDQGYTYLMAQKYTEALDLFCRNRPTKVNRFKTIQKWIEQKQFDQFDHLLEENIQYHKNKLKLKD